MTTKTYFCTTQYLKDNTPINLNVDDTLLTMAILDAQNLYVQPVLGTKLYNKISSLIASGDISTPTYVKYKDLLDNWILDCVTHYAMVEALPYVRYKIMNKSVGGQSSDNSNPGDLEDMKFVLQNIRNKAEFYCQRLADHVLQYHQDYPEYTNATKIDEMRPDGVAYFSGMELEDRHSSCDRTMGYNSHTKNLNW